MKVIEYYKNTYLFSQFLNSSCLPEIPVERNTKNNYTERSDNIPLVPTLFDKRFVVSCESNKLNLFSGWFFSKERYCNHKQHDEDKQPNLKDKPVGMPKPSS